LKARATVDERDHDRVIVPTVTDVLAGKDPLPDIERDHETASATTVNGIESPPAAVIMSRIPVITESELAAERELDQVQTAVEEPVTMSITEKTVVPIVVPDAQGINRQNHPSIIPANRNEITTMNAIVHLIARPIGIARETATITVVIKPSKGHARLISD